MQAARSWAQLRSSGSSARVKVLVICLDLHRKCEHPTRARRFAEPAECCGQHRWKIRESCRRAFDRPRPRSPTGRQRSAATRTELPLYLPSLPPRHDGQHATSQVARLRPPSHATGRDGCALPPAWPVLSPRHLSHARAASPQRSRASGAGRSYAGSGAGHASTPHAR